MSRRRIKKGPWHYVGAAGEPAFLNSYTNYGGGYQSARFRKDSDGMVTLAGLVANAFSFGVASDIFVLPAAFQPTGFGAPTAGYIYVAQIALGGTPAAARVDVFQDGEVILQQGTSGLAIGYLSLDGISFYQDF